MPVTLNWASAEVKDGKLVVALEGDVPSGWKQSFERTVTLLRGGEWGKVQVRKDAVSVSEVGSGTEEKLKHFLESVVEQANADHAPDEEDEDSEDESSDKDESADADDDGPDAEMTERFRSFGD
jgi:hypothetical protein